MTCLSWAVCITWRTRGRTTTSSLTISFESAHSFFTLSTSDLTHTPLEAEHIRREVHTTMTVAEVGEEEEGNAKEKDLFNRSWVRSTDLKRELKEKLLKAQQEQMLREQQ